MCSCYVFHISLSRDGGLRRQHIVICFSFLSRDSGICGQRAVGPVLAGANSGMETTRNVLVEVVVEVVVVVIAVLVLLRILLL